ncbi:LysR family transcriptional regulator [Vibrio sp. 10N.261.55.A7]|uniref:LysR family transcriptional regulator n=1 Tax=Vibrio sp. 10N.261.55.A7 TaxID=1880851 RepID=UPI000C866B9E|nr:LysR family transcriptional regulator [Vibrio sp. 10N.261.55.A7]PMJ91701.1 transcriptional regulator [Vibrio sp. 10N.261.55.A7]
MLNNMNLNLLRSLHILLEERHVSRAADRLHISQSAVSRQLAQLRELCGDPLLVRQGNQLIATPRAVALKEKLDALLSEFDRFLDEKPFNAKEWQGEVVLASSDYVAQYVLPDIASHLGEHAPQLDIAYRLWQPDLLEKLHETGIHLASSMYQKKPEGVSSVNIGSDYSVCLMSDAHPLAKQDALTVDNLLQFSHIKVTGGGDKDSNTDLALKALGVSRHISLKVPFFSAAINRLVSSEHLMIVPEHIADNLTKHGSLTYKSLPFDMEQHQYWLMWHPKYDNDSGHKWLREEVRAVMSWSEYSIRD